MSYDYKYAKSRLLEILDDNSKIKNIDMLSQDESEFETSGVETWVSVIYIDIKNQAEIITQDSRKNISKVIKSFTSEIVNILNSKLVKEIKINKGYIYAVYNSPTRNNIYEIADKTYYVNTWIKMVNILLNNRNLPTYKIGIGMSTNKEFVIKTCSEMTEVNNKLWMGRTIDEAMNLAKISNSVSEDKIAFGETSYMNFIESLILESEESKSWFTEHKHPEYNKYYTASISITEFDNWIKNGMKE
ncbi:adenylate cyclase [Mycoplasmatota bacterium]|nr:adenylate cyclase [Mycoplasmatota bacterium]